MTHVMEQNESEALPEKPLYFEAVPIAGQAQMKQTPEDEKKAEVALATPKRKKARNEPKMPDTGRSSKSDPVSPPKTPPSSSKRKSR